MTLSDIYSDVKTWLMIDEDDNIRLPFASFVSLANRAARHIALQHKWPFLIKTSLVYSDSTDYNKIPVPEDMMILDRIVEYSSAKKVFVVDNELIEEFYGSRLVKPDGLFAAQVGDYFKLFPEQYERKQFEITYYKWPYEEKQNPPSGYPDNEIRKFMLDTYRWLILRDSALFVRETEPIEFFERMYNESLSDDIYRYAISQQSGERKFANEPG